MGTEIMPHETIKHQDMFMQLLYDSEDSLNMASKFDSISEIKVDN